MSHKTFRYRCQKDSACTAIHVDKTLAGCCRTDQCFAGTLDGELQTAAPCDRHIAVYLEYVVFKLDLHQFFPGTGGLQTQNSVSDNTQVEQPFVSGNSN